MMIIVFKIMKVDNNYEIKKNTRFKFFFGNDNNCLKKKIKVKRTEQVAKSNFILMGKNLDVKLR